MVNTDDRDVYYGAHAMIRKPPSDPRVNALRATALCCRYTFRSTAKKVVSSTFL